MYKIRTIYMINLLLVVHSSYSQIHDSSRDRGKISEHSPFTAKSNGEKRQAHAARTLATRVGVAQLYIRPIAAAQALRPTPTYYPTPPDKRCQQREQLL